jgi:hypothetical protein
MCMACEQDGIWLAYLESKGLLNPDDPAAVADWDAPTPEAPDTAPNPVAKNPFSCDDPTNG